MTAVCVLLQFREELHPAAEVKLGQRYAVMSSYSSQWSRASVVEILSEEKVSVFNCYLSTQSVRRSSLRLSFEQTV